MLVEEAKRMRTSDADDDKSIHLLGDVFTNSQKMSDSSQSNSAVNKVKIEVLQFLRDKRRDLCVLKDYPQVWQVFRKYNCVLSSSALV